MRPVVAGQLRERRAEIVEAICAHVREGVPDPAGDQDSEYLAGLRTAVAAAVDYGLMGIEREEQCSVPTAAVEQARRAARDGVRLETVLRRYALGHTLLGDYILQVAEHQDLPGHGAAARSVLRGQGSLLNQLMASVASEYWRERERAGRSREQRRAERVQRLLAGTSVDTSEFDYDFDAWHVGVIAIGAGAREAVQAVAERLGRQLLLVSRADQTVWAWLGARRGPAFAGFERLMREMKLRDIVSAVGEPGRGLDGWRLTHRQAQAARAVALRRPRRLTRYGDIALLASALENDMVTQSLRDIYLAPLDELREGAVLRQTLRAYFAAGCNAATTAAALKVDRHTVRRRLRTIEQCLGRSVPTCQVELEMALRLQALDDADTSDDRSES